MNKTSGRLSVLAVTVACGLLMTGGARRHAVSIEGMAFSPSSLNVGAGDTVTWSNQDDREHALSADDGSFASGKIAAGAMFSHTFGKPGKYTYGCKFHPREKGSISVGD